MTHNQAAGLKGSKPGRPRRSRTEKGTRQPARASEAVAPMQADAGLAVSGSLDTSVEDLRAVPLFASLSEANLAKLAQEILKQRAAAGQTLCCEGEGGQQMYVVLSGAVTLCKTVDGHRTELGRLESGAHFGEMALIGDAPRTATIVAASDIEYLSIDRQTLMRVIARYPSVALQILKGYNARLADTTQRLARLSVSQAATEKEGAAELPPPETLSPQELYCRAVEHTIAHGPYPLATLVRKMQVEDDWSRKVLQGLDVFEVVVKYTVLLLLAGYLRRPTGRTLELDQMIVAAFRRPTLGQLIEMSTRVLRCHADRAFELFIPELYWLYFRPDGRRGPITRAFQALTAYRNRLKHGAESVWPEDVFRLDFEGEGDGLERRAGIKDYVATILSEVAFLKDYPLVYLTSMTYEHGTFQYSYQRCTGAYADFDHGTFAHSTPLENKQLYLLCQRDERILQLHPLIRRIRCHECAQPAIFIVFNFFPEKERPPRAVSQEPGSAPGRRREKLEYLSYACGHTFAEQISDDQVERGEGLSRLLMPTH